MKLDNYLNLNQDPIQFSFAINRTSSFREIVHAHQGIELLYVHEGSGRTMIDDAVYKVRSGSIFCFKPYQMHNIQMELTPDVPYVRTMILFEPSVLLPYAQAFPILASFLLRMWKDFSLPCCVQHTDPDGFAKLLQAYKSIGDPHQDWSAHTEKDNNALQLLQLLQLMLPSFTGESSETGKSRLTLSPAVSQMIAWMEAHYAEQFHLHALAQSVHLTPNHVSYMFHKETGSTLSDYLKSRRMKQACILLKTTSLPIREIGQQIGLTNFAYFCQLFKSIIGVSPSRYRSRHDSQDAPVGQTSRTGLAHTL